MRDIILARLAALLEEKIDPKLRAERLKRKSKAYDNRVHKNYTAQPRDEDPPPSDDELKDMAKDYGYGKKEEAIDFPKTTTRGKAARATAADTLRDVKSRMQTSGLAKKPGDAAKLTKQFSKENYKQREPTNLKDRMVEALMEARGDASQKLGVDLPRDPNVDYGTTPVVPARGSPRAKRFAEKVRRTRANIKAAKAETPESRRAAAEEGAAKLAQLRASNRARNGGASGGTFTHRSGRQVER